MTVFVHRPPKRALVRKMKLAPWSERWQAWCRECPLHIKKDRWYLAYHEMNRHVHNEHNRRI